MTVRLLTTLLLLGAFAGSALADCPGMRMVKKPDVLASTEGTTATDPVKLPATPRPN